MARLVITIEGANAERVLKKLNTEAKKLGGTTKRLSKSVKGVDNSLKGMSGSIKGLIGAAGVAGLTQVLRGATTAAIEQAQAEAQLAQGIRSTGGAAGLTAKELVKLASGLQSITTFGDEAIIRAESILLTFTKIQGETFPATTRAVVDLAAKMGTDLSAAAIQLGKALNDPVANLGELGRAGIQFDPVQKALIKSLFQGGEAAKAQAIILEELTRQFGGSAEAAAKAAGGGYLQAINAFSDMSEGLGNALLPTLDSAGRLIAKSGGTMKQFAETVTLTITPVLLLGKAWQAITGDGEELVKVLVTQTSRFGDLEEAVGSLNKEINNHSLEISDLAAKTATLNAIKEEQARLEKAEEERAKALTEILRGMREEVNADALAFEAMLDAVTELKGGLAEIEIIAGRFEELDLAKPFEGLLNISGDLNMLGGAADADTLFGAVDDDFDDLKGKFENLGDQVFGILSGAIISALKGGDINYEQLGSALGTVIGNAIAPGVGGAVGGLIGGLAGGLFGGGGGDTGPTFADRLNTLGDDINAMLDSAGGFISQITDVFRDINTLVQEAISLGSNLENVMEAAKVKVESLRDTILGIDIEDFGNRLAAALRFNQGLGLELFGGGIQPGTLGGGGAGGGVGGRGAGEGGAVPEAFGAVIEGGREFNEVLTEQAGHYDVLGINLTVFAEQLISEFAGVSFEFQSVQATAEALRESIVGLNLVEEDQVRLIEAVTKAEMIRMAELENDVLQRLVNVLTQIPSLQEDAARLQAQINQARFQIEVKMIELQLNAMNLMTSAFAAMLQVATAFGQTLSNFNVGAGGGGFNFRAPRRFRGGGGRSARQSARDRAQQDMERLTETLQGLASEPAFNTLNDRMVKLKDTFFGPGGFAEEAKRLGVSMDLVNAAFRRQRQNLMEEANRGIREFLEGLGTSRLNPAGLGARFGSAQSSFRELLARAQQGDLNARSELGGSARTLLDLAQQRFGNTRRFRQVFEQVQGSLQDILGTGASTIDGQKIQLAQRQVELLEIIAGVGTGATPSNMLFFDKADQAAAAEIKLLRADNAQARDIIERQRRQWHEAKITEAQKLRQEVEVGNQTRPRVNQVSSRRL